MSSDDIVTILVADDHPMFRYGLRSVFASETRTSLVGEASTGDEAVKLAEELKPDVVIMDLTMPGLNGIEATRQILAQRPETRVLVVSMSDDSASVLTAVRAGACGYLIKGADREEVLRAVFAAAAGEAIFSSSAAGHLTRQLAVPHQPTAIIPGLTNREHDILALMANGYTNADMSEHLGLSPKTIRNYVSTILAKLGDIDRPTAIERARAAGIGHQQ
jgi:DNA-binding NarL/FixJ family response regulator